MSEVTSCELDGDCVPTPATQEPLHGAQTPTMAPDDPVAAFRRNFG